MSNISISEVRKMRKEAKKQGLKLFVKIDEPGSPRCASITHLTNHAYPYGTPGFRCKHGDGWYSLSGAPWKFFIA